MTHRCVAGYLLVGLAGLALTGCGRPYKPGPNPVEIDAQEYGRVFQASVDVLRDRGFRLNRRDHRFGLVTTYPLTSPTAFEPWIGHNTAGHLTAQSTLDHLRRTVTVSLEPVTPEEHAAVEELGVSLDPAVEGGAGQPDDGADRAELAWPEAYRLRVEVLLENQQVPVRRLNGSVTGSRFSELDAVPAEWASRNIGGAYWQPIGRDPALEQRLARAIVERSLRLAE